MTGMGAIAPEVAVEERTRFAGLVHVLMALP